MRLTVQKAFVRQDCGRRYAAAMLRKSRPISKKYNVGDMVMYRSVQGALAPGEEWHGPARIIGFEGSMVWLQSAGVPVASAVHLLRPSSTAELLAHQLESRARTPMVTEAGPAHEQMGCVDARGEAPVPTDLVEAPLAVQAPIEASAPAATLSDDEGDTDEAADEQQVLAIRDMKEEPQDQPVAKRTRLARDPLTSETMQQPVDDDSFDTPLDRHLESIGVTMNDPGPRLARSLAEPVSRARSRSRGHEATASLAYAFHATEDPSMKNLLEEFEDFQKFFAERVERPAAK